MRGLQNPPGVGGLSPGRSGSLLMVAGVRGSGRGYPPVLTQCFRVKTKVRAGTGRGAVEG